MKLTILLLLACPAIIAAAMTSMNPEQLSELTKRGEAFLAESTEVARRELETEPAHLVSKRSACQAIAQSYVDRCIDCVKAKCQARAESCGKELTFGQVVLHSLNQFAGQAISAVTNFGQTIGNGIIGIGQGIGNIGKKLVGGLKKLFGRRELQKRRSEPACNEFSTEEAAAQACLKYVDYCPICTAFDPMVHCKRYVETRQVHESQIQTHSWVKKITLGGKTYQVEAVAYDPASFDSATGAYKSVSVTVSLYGKRVTFYSKVPLDVFNMAVTGHSIAGQALKWFKLNV